MADDINPLMRELLSNWSRNEGYSRAGPYRTNLPPQQEVAFQRWVRHNNVPFDPHQTIQDYDMRGFWNGLQSGDPRARSAIDPNDQRLHYPDVWKTPYHQTFSADSQWAGPGAPQWQENRLMGADGNVLFDAAAPPPR